MTEKGYKYLPFLIKGGISVAVIIYLVHHLWKTSYQVNHLGNLLWLPAIVSFFMIAINIGMEGLKWRTMVRNFYPETTLKSAIEAVLAGMTTGIFTPNRIGEYGGRIFLLPPGRRVEAVVLMFVDRICQMMVTLWMGAFAFLGYIYWKTEWPMHLRIWGAVGVVVVSIAMIWLAFARKPMIRILSRFRHYKYLRIAHSTLEQLNPGLLGKVLLLSAIRYGVFTLQFVLLLYAYGYTQGVGLAIWMIVLMYLFKSFVPSIALSELGIRETIAIAVMGEFGVPSEVAFNATFLLYLYNLALPSVLGMYLLPRMRIFGKKVS